MKNKTISAALASLLFVSAFAVGSFAFAPAAHAQSDDGGDYSGGCCGDYYNTSFDSGDYYNTSYGQDTGDYYNTSYGEDTGDYYNTSFGDTGSNDQYSDTSGSNSSMPSFSGGSNSYSLPTFGSANYTYRAANNYPVYVPPTNAPSNTTVNTNTCTNNSCNSSYVDNSVVDNSVRVSGSSACTTCGCQGYGACAQPCVNYNSGYSNSYGYNNVYNSGSNYNYNAGYNGNCNTYTPPVAYNTTPYITLSQAPYTGLDLGPFGEVAYWTFLVLWCLGAAYLIVVKRVQNKLVSFLNGFLFGRSASTTVAHNTAYAPVAHTHTVAASAPLVEEGIDPFIASQIKRS